MSKQNRGEHSRSDEPNEHEKPLKKARFLWEVKGKHHLKDTCKNNNNTSQNHDLDEVDVPEQNNKVEVSSSLSKHAANCEKKETCNCLQQFLSKSEDFMESIYDDEFNSNQIDEENDFPLSLLGPQEKNNDYYLRKWQARQIARGFVDNTINSVLETWTIRPFDDGDFVENCRNDGQVEDDAILMAIQEHGLQSRGEARDGGRLRFSNELREQMANILIRETTEKLFNPDQGCDSFTQTGENLEFINAAVSAAIEKNGLSYRF